MNLQGQEDCVTVCHWTTLDDTHSIIVPSACVCECVHEILLLMPPGLSIAAELLNASLTCKQYRQMPHKAHREHATGICEFSSAAHVYSIPAWARTFVKTAFVGALTVPVTE